MQPDDSDESLLNLKTSPIQIKTEPHLFHTMPTLTPEQLTKKLEEERALGASGLTNERMRY